MVGRDIGIGHELRSCTKSVNEFEAKLGNETVLLVDTPGFDDSGVPDVGVLKVISDWLKKRFVIPDTGYVLLIYRQKCPRVCNRRSHLPSQD
jgi:predicted GTPase